jgi:hypothetical protein
LFFSVSVFATEQNIEKIIVIRHGEKPSVEIGQLNCKGLNRSLLLPQYFQTNFAKPDYIFAPNPSVQISGNGNSYSYLRPLATIEPTAISLDMPVNAQIGFNQPDQLMAELLKSQYHNTTIYVAWEHKNIEKFAQMMLAQFNNAAPVPAWPESDFDQVYVFTIDWSATPATLTFDVTSEGMHHINKSCPN